MKLKRHSALLEIIEREAIDTQEVLCERLREMGFDVTQATVSRDVKTLRLTKITDSSGRTRYTAGGDQPGIDSKSRLRIILIESIVKVDRAINIVVIKTLPGVANAAAAALDGMNFPDVVGSIAGDDNIFLVFRSEPKAADFCRMINGLIEN